MRLKIIEITQLTKYIGYKAVICKKILMPRAIVALWPLLRTLKPTIVVENLRNKKVDYEKL